MSNVYEIITERIVEKLKAGTAPWQKPWNSEAGMPKNLISKKEYRGINVFLLSCSNYSSPWFVTYKQAMDLKGHIKKGEKGQPVVYWNWTKNTDPETNEEVERAFLKYYTVFNSSQAELPDGAIPPEGPKKENNPIESCEKIVHDMPNIPSIKKGNSRAFYSPSGDYIGMPNIESFIGSEEYYSTLFHEMTHSTGHESRLSRLGVRNVSGEHSSFGSNPYAKEELVAEMGAAFLCGIAGIENKTIDNSASYLQAWIRRLTEDPKLIVMAGSQSQKAVDFIINKREVKVD